MNSQTVPNTLSFNAMNQCFLIDDDNSDGLNKINFCHRHIDVDDENAAVFAEIMNDDENQHISLVRRNFSG